MSESTELAPEDDTKVSGTASALVSLSTESDLDILAMTSCGGQLRGEPVSSGDKLEGRGDLPLVVWGGEGVLASECAGVATATIDVEFVLVVNAEMLEVFLSPRCGDVIEV